MPFHLRTVHIEPFPHFPAVLVTSEDQVDSEDVVPAVQNIMQRLSTTDVPMYVIMDVLNNPQGPLNLTFNAARAPFSHPMLRELLIIGNSYLARIITRLLMNFTNRHNVRWFRSYPEMIAYLHKSSQTEAPTFVKTPIIEKTITHKP